LEGAIPRMPRASIPNLSEDFLQIVCPGGARAGARCLPGAAFLRSIPGGGHGPCRPRPSLADLPNGILSELRPGVWSMLAPDTLNIDTCAGPSHAVHGVALFPEQLLHGTKFSCRAEAASSNGFLVGPCARPLRPASVHPRPSHAAIWRAVAAIGSFRFFAPPRAPANSLLRSLHQGCRGLKAISDLASQEFRGEGRHKMLPPWPERNGLALTSMDIDAKSDESEFHRW